MLEYLLTSEKSLELAALRVRLPQLSTNNLGVHDLKITPAHYVIDEFGRVHYSDSYTIALCQVNLEIFALLANRTECCLTNYPSTIHPVESIDKYLLRGIRPPVHKRQRCF